MGKKYKWRISWC